MKELYVNFTSPRVEITYKSRKKGWFICKLLFQRLDSGHKLHITNKNSMDLYVNRTNFPVWQKINEKPEVCYIPRKTPVYHKFTQASA